MSISLWRFLLAVLIMDVSIIAGVFLGLRIRMIQCVKLLKLDGWTVEPPERSCHDAR